MIELATLDPAAGMAMLDHLLGPSPRLAALKARILQHTGALPLFVEEVCLALPMFKNGKQLVSVVRDCVQGVLLLESLVIAVQMLTSGHSQRTLTPLTRHKPFTVT